MYILAYYVFTVCGFFTMRCRCVLLFVSSASKKQCLRISTSCAYMRAELNWASLTRREVRVLLTHMRTACVIYTDTPDRKGYVSHIDSLVYNLLNYGLSLYLLSILMREHIIFWPDPPQDGAGFSIHANLITTQTHITVSDYKKPRFHSNIQNWNARNAQFFIPPTPPSSAWQIVSALPFRHFVWAPRTAAQFANIVRWPNLW